MTDFDRILDDAFSRLEAGESIDAVLSRYPEHAEALAPLLETAALSLHAYSYTEPASRAGMTRGRQRFLSEAARRAEKHQTREPRDRWPALLRPVSRWAVAVAALLVLLLAAGTTAVVASADSLPGSPLYPVKIAAEEVQLTLTHGPAPRARLHMARAERRKRELDALLARQEPVRVDLLTSSLNEAEAALRELSRVPAEQRLQPLDRYVEFALAQAEELEETRLQAPPAQQPLLDSAAVRYRELADLARTTRTYPDAVIPVPTGTRLPAPTATPTPPNTPSPPTPEPTRRLVPASPRPTASATGRIRPHKPTPTATSTRPKRRQTPAMAATAGAATRLAPATVRVRPTSTPTPRPSVRPVTPTPSPTPTRRPPRPSATPIPVATALVTPQPGRPTPTRQRRPSPTPTPPPVVTAQPIPTQRPAPTPTPTATERPATRPTPTAAQRKPSPTPTRQREPSPTPQPVATAQRTADPALITTPHSDAGTCAIIDLRYNRANVMKSNEEPRFDADNLW